MRGQLISLTSNRAAQNSIIEGRTHPSRSFWTETPDSCWFYVFLVHWTRLDPIEYRGGHDKVIPTLHTVSDLAGWPNKPGIWNYVAIAIKEFNQSTSITFVSCSASQLYSFGLAQTHCYSIKVGLVDQAEHFIMKPDILILHIAGAELWQ